MLNLYTVGISLQHLYFDKKHVLHCTNINILMSTPINGFNDVLIILQICDNVKGHHKFIVSTLFPLISKNYFKGFLLRNVFYRTIVPVPSWVQNHNETTWNTLYKCIKHMKMSNNGETDVYSRIAIWQMRSMSYVDMQSKLYGDYNSETCSICYACTIITTT